MNGEKYFAQNITVIMNTEVSHPIYCKHCSEFTASAYYIHKKSMHVSRKVIGTVNVMNAVTKLQECMHDAHNSQKKTCLYHCNLIPCKIHCMQFSYYMASQDILMHSSVQYTSQV